MVIKYFIQRNYGQDMRYPQCETGKAWLKIQQRKTFIDADLKLFALMGVKFEQVLKVA